MAISLLTSIDSTSHTHLIIGSNPLAASRCTQSLSVGARVIVIAPPTSEIHYSLQKRIDDGEVKYLGRNFDPLDISTLGRAEIGGYVDAVFVTLSPRDPRSAQISSLCRSHRVPINVSDSHILSTFSLLSTHIDGPLQIGVTTNGRGCKLSSRIRREIAASLPPNLGSACERLGSIRRRIQAEDARSRGDVGAEAEGEGDDEIFKIQASGEMLLGGGGGGEEEDSVDQSSTFNKLVLESDVQKNRRLRWLSQICEYWPLPRLVAINDSDADSILTAYKTSTSTTTTTTSHSPPLDLTTLDARSKLPKKGLIILAGSGPGHPDLLTRATHKAILHADLILADKLVPSAVLSLIPRRTPVHIARKFPGNAEAAQTELLTLGLAGLQRGETVLRLKQGDPYIYGRGGEEFEFFRKHGYAEDRIVVLPGITSALSAPLFAKVPATQRGCSDQVLVCTGTGRRGVPSRPPEWVESRTVVFLMALHRVEGLVGDLTTHAPERGDGVGSLSLSLSRSEKVGEGGNGDGGGGGGGAVENGEENKDTTTTTTAAARGSSNHDKNADANGVSNGRGSHGDALVNNHNHNHNHDTQSSTTHNPHKRALFPLTTPCAVIERASCPDQRVIRTTLEYVAAAIAELGSRPPGLLVVGRACEVLVGCGSENGGENGGNGVEEMEGMKGGKERRRKWVVEEGFGGLGDFGVEGGVLGGGLEGLVGVGGGGEGGLSV